MIMLQSDRLRVEIAEPMEAPNRTIRFDRAGFIAEVVLDGAVHFCANEPQNLAHPSSGGRGLCNEFTADFSRDVKPGDYFPKLGVGLIRRDEEPYVFHKKYSDVQDFPVEFTVEENQVEFRTKAVTCNQVAVSFTKTIRLLGNAVTMEVTATNEGEAALDTMEYCHNFISIDGMAISPEYEVDLPDLPDMGAEQKLNMRGQPCNWKGNGKGLTFVQCTTDCAHVRVPLEGLQNEDIFHWTLRHRGAKAWVEVTEYFRPEKMTIWSVDHMVSPEVFYHLSLQSGETKTWKRQWVFDKAY